MVTLVMMTVTVVSSHLSDSVHRLVQDKTVPSSPVAGMLAVCYRRVWSPVFSLVIVLGGAQNRSSILSCRAGTLGRG